jgi:hypothetical protein
MRTSWATIFVVAGFLLFVIGTIVGVFFKQWAIALVSAGLACWSLSTLL